MFYVCARDLCPFERYTIVDINTKVVENLSLYELVDRVKISNFGNIILSNSRLRGKGYNLANFTSNNKRGRLFVADVLLKNMVIAKYRCISSVGNIVEIPVEQAVFYFRKYGIVNGRVLNNEVYGKPVIELYENSYRKVNIINNNLYDIEDYMYLLKEYAEVGLSMDKTITSNFEINEDDAFVRSDYTDNIIESFISAHKRMCRVLSGIKEYSKTTVYKNVRAYYKNSKYKTEGKDTWGYKVNFEYEEQQYSILVSNKDFKLRGVLNNKKCNEIKPSFTDFVSLITYSIEEIENSNGSVATSLEKSSNFNTRELKLLGNCLRLNAVNFYLKKGIYKSDSGYNFKIKNSIKINSGETKVLFNNMSQKAGEKTAINN